MITNAQDKTADIVECDTDFEHQFEMQQQRLMQEKAMIEARIRANMLA